MHKTIKMDYNNRRIQRQTAWKPVIWNIKVGLYSSSNSEPADSIKKYWKLKVVL